MYGELLPQGQDLDVFVAVGSRKQVEQGEGCWPGRARPVEAARRIILPRGWSSLTWTQPTVTQMRQTDSVVAENQIPAGHPS